MSLGGDHVVGSCAVKRPASTERGLRGCCSRGGTNVSLQSWASSPQGPPDMNVDLDNLGRPLVGRWTTEATHPAMPGTVIAGSSHVEWLDGEKFLLYGTHYDHPNFPDAISIIGDTDGLQMHYFDTRGVHRLFELTVSEDGWAIAMDRHSDPHAYAPNDQPFSQRMTYIFERGDQKVSGHGALSDNGVLDARRLAMELVRRAATRQRRRAHHV